MDISLAPYVQIDQPIKKIFLWGMMGVGKTTYGKQMAKALNWEWIDLDAMIEENEARSIDSIFSDEGEAYFRTLEENYLRSLEEQDHVVISTGGGTPHVEGLADWMRERGLCIWLDAPAAALMQRLSSATVQRPLLKNMEGEELLKHLQARIDDRQSSYRKAHMIVNVLKMKPKALNAQVASIIQGKR